MGVVAVPGIEGRIPTPEHVVVAAEVMGTFRVAVDGLEIPAATWQRTAATTLFKLLLIAPHQRLSREAAAEILWPEMDPCHQATNLRKALHFARKTLERGKPVIAGHRYISLAPGVELRLEQPPQSPSPLVASWNRAYAERWRNADPPEILACSDRRA